MQFNLRWLEEWLGTPLEPQALSHRLTMAGLEVDSLAPASKRLSHIIAGCIQRIEPHPNADRLKVCKVDIGEQDLLQIVCGATNTYEGMYVPVALVGGQIDDMKINRVDIRGIQSDGMLCAAVELGLNNGTEGLFDLSGEVAVGTNIVDYLSLDDTIFNLDLTPNRSDCLSLLGLAREVAALSGDKLKDDVHTEVKSINDDEISLQVQESEACPRYLYSVVAGLDATAKIPLWLGERLRRCGIQLVHPVVDVMNYVMLELGQPLHAFDLDKIKGDITVRLAQSGEHIDLLNGKQAVPLDKATLLIADDAGPIAIAGIMGGSRCAVDTDTTNVLIECAYFSPAAILGRARLYGLHTDASHRFERGVDFQLQKRAIERARVLLSQICGGEFGRVREKVSASDFPERNAIELNYETIERCLGVTPDRHQIARDLSNLGLGIKPRRGGWTCVPPSFRFDLSIESDLIEEIGRIYGYDHIAGTLPSFAPTSTALQRQDSSLEHWSDRLVSLGYHEAITYGFTAAESCSAFPEVPDLILDNPVSPELSVMRPSLWPNLLKVLTYNLHRQQSSLRLFEVGRKFLHQENKLFQPTVIAGLVYGNVFPEQWGRPSSKCDFYDIKGDVESLLQPWRDDLIFEPGTVPLLHPGQAVQILVKDQVIGSLGMLHPAYQQIFDVVQEVFLFEIEPDKLDAAVAIQFEKLSRFPFVRRDISVIVLENVNVVQLLNAIEGLELSILVKVVVFDVYTDAKASTAQKSLTFGLTFQKASDTLEDEEINQGVKEIIEVLAHKFNATIKGATV